MHDDVRRHLLALSFSSGSASSDPLLLDDGEKCILGIEMPPLLRGEYQLLAYLGSRPQTWHTSRALAVHVYERDDAAARQLVWKYSSMLRMKLAKALPGLVVQCRRRGYSCRNRVMVVNTSAPSNGEHSGV